MGGSASSGSKAAAPAPAAAAAPSEPTDYANFTQTLTQLISSELGLRGFTLTLAVVFVAATFLPGLGLAIRRQHDIGLSGWYSLLALIPSLGSLALLAFSLIPSQKRDNRWGPGPENLAS